ncbi:PREDICTED: uncharacterized serine-rich protein C1E8.05-like, partial [Ficedula albicollis]|uniref:uncharacterized serine-rich protein C1E8.05-like n=1 Tax=Ficedula albicollis TaxID=59894 RepID=UPI0007AD8646
ASPASPASSVSASSASSASPASPASSVSASSASSASPASPASSVSASSASSASPASPASSVSASSASSASPASPASSVSASSASSASPASPASSVSASSASSASPASPASSMSQQILLGQLKVKTSEFAGSACLLCCRSEPGALCKLSEKACKLLKLPEGRFSSGTLIEECIVLKVQLCISELGMLRAQHSPAQLLLHQIHTSVHGHSPAPGGSLTAFPPTRDPGPRGSPPDLSAA